MTGSELCTAARAINPHIQLRDVWHLLRQMLERKLVVCLNPRLVTGRLFLLTTRGHSAVHTAFGIQVSPAPHLDWRKYSRVVRAKIRRLTLNSLGQLEDKTGEPHAATAIRKHLRSEHAIGLNPVLRALRDLTALRLVRSDTIKCGYKVHRLTRAGRRILEQMRR